jgi:hypothetical protein
MSRVAPPGSRGGFCDVAVIYPSTHDKGKWVAHSLITDQIGVGDSVLDAFVDLRRALRTLLDAAHEDSSIEVFRAAPEEIRKKLLHAKKLPAEIIEIADMQVTGTYDVSLAKPWKPTSRTLSAPLCV